MERAKARACRLSLFSRQDGFTLTEILVAMAIMSILAAIAIPNWSTLLPTYALSGAARQVQSELQKTKSRAVSENTAYRLVFSSTSYSIERDTGSGYQSAGENKPLPEGITLGSLSATTLSFTTGGGSNGGTIMLCNIKNAGYNVVVASTTGRITICKPSSCNGTC